MAAPASPAARSARAVLKKLLVKAAMRMRREELLSGAVAVRIRFIGHDQCWERDVAFDPTGDSRELLRLLNGMLDSGNRRPLPLGMDARVPRAQATAWMPEVEQCREQLPNAQGWPGPVNATPPSVSVTLMRLVPRTQSSGSLFAPTHDTGRVDAGRIDALVDRINAKFGYNKLCFRSMQLALEHDAAPMRIPFNRVPDTKSENEATHESDASHDPLWLQTMNRFRAMAEGEHRRREQRDKR